MAVWLGWLDRLFPGRNCEACVSASGDLLVDSLGYLSVDPLEE